jgi:hypothetical protein
MKMFSDCSGECCVCSCAGGCLAGHDDDDFTPATKEQIIERLDDNKYSRYHDYMKLYLKEMYNYEYEKRENKAHWIIECHGFGGTIYTCSECRDSWNDNYTDVSMNDKCPSCGAEINDDENEYIEHKKSKINAPIIPTSLLGKFIKKSDESETIIKHEEPVSKLIKVSGYDVEKLIELFAAGYTLQPPNYKDINII